MRRSNSLSARAHGVADVARYVDLYSQFSSCTPLRHVIVLYVLFGVKVNVSNSLHFGFDGRMSGMTSHSCMSCV